MSYCRLGPDSDVYVIKSVSDLSDFYCCYSFSPAHASMNTLEFSTAMPLDMIAHLESHQACGDLVPAQAIARLYNDDAYAMGAPDHAWDAHIVTSLAKNVCPYSGLGGPECKESVCDCSEFEDIWGVKRS